MNQLPSGIYLVEYKIGDDKMVSGLIISIFMRDSMIFYRSFYEAIVDLPREVQGDIYTAIFEYGLDGKEPENLKPIARTIFRLIKPNLDSNIKRYENGKKGGRPSNKKNQIETEDKANKNVDKDEDEDIELIYNLYPTRCVVKNSSTGKSTKNKDKIKIVLKTISKEKLIETINWYIDECKKHKTYMLNFSTFLNNIPEIPEDAVINLEKPQGRVRQ